MPVNNSIKKSTPPGCDSCEGRSQSIFCCLTEDELKKLSVNKNHNLYKKGQVIFFEGNHPNGLFCIYSGKVKVHKMGDDGKEQIVRLAKKGDILGYRALLSNEPYFASATAIEDTTVCYLSKSSYLNILLNNPQLSLETIKLLSSDLKYAEEMIISMAQKPVRERIAETLLMLKEYYGIDESSNTINAVLTREDIGNLAGTTTETSIRVLSDLNKENVIDLMGKKIKILDQKKLVKIAHLNE